MTNINALGQGGIDERTRAQLLQMAAESIALSTIQTLMPMAKQSVPEKRAHKERGRSSKVGFNFTKKEMKSIPTMYKNIFACNDKIIPYRFHKGVYEAYYRRQGLNVYACAKSFDEMKRKFILKLNEMAEQGASPTQTTKPVIGSPQPVKEVDVLFTDYVRQWLEIKRKTTKPSTYKEYERLCSFNLIKEFGGMAIGKMTRNLIQEYLFRIDDEGKHRTAEKLAQILTCIFDLAVEDLNITSPMKKIVLPYYETKKGKCLTKEEEVKLVSFCREHKDNAASSALLVLLYFGLRKSELCTIEIGEEELTCISSKTRLGRGEVKRFIPFTPVFKKVLDCVDFAKAKNVNVHTVETAFKRLLPEHHVHELRYTFITRAKECSVNHEVVMLWDGHSFDKDVKTSVVDRGYTDYSKEYMRKEAEKVNYKLP